MTNPDIAAIIAPKVREWEAMAKNFAKSRFLVAASEYGMNDNESAELTRIADEISIDLSLNDNQLGLSVEYNKSPYLKVIEEGMPAPLTGGQNGLVTMPDGTKVHSNVPEQLWNNPIPEYAKEGENVKEEVLEMLRPLFKDAVEEAISESNKEIAEAYKPIVLSRLREELGGDFQ